MDEMVAMEKHFMENKVESSLKESELAAKTFNIKVAYFLLLSLFDSFDTIEFIGIRSHHCSKQHSGGWKYSVSFACLSFDVCDLMVETEILRSRTKFNPVGVNWILAGIDRTVNTDWYLNSGPGTLQQTTMKRALHKGGAGDFNFYTVGPVTLTTVTRRIPNGRDEGVLGYATFPVSYRTNPLDDGVIVRTATLPGGSASPYNLGQTLTHEAGHWVGLYHTFQGGCVEPGDYVTDTPSEASAASGCPDRRDTCPGGGPDPIHNFMDYTIDACMNAFTPGQAARLSQQLTTYRGL
ncbi:hypothetical protein C0995_004519 [Termitomyces sp. Mi166|nr:hypothetical protein C0995_004519 [Termitomyces sp. Mi166\